MNVRVRFAPSPTGFLHVGGVRTVLFNYLFARKHGGQFILRLEDTDRERFVADSVRQIVDGLDWLGLTPDEGFWITDGKHQNIDYVQSERQKTGNYQKVADKLIEQGLAYYSQIEPSQYEALKNQERSGPFVYKKTMEPEGESKDRPIRLDTAAAAGRLTRKAIKWNDEVRGPFSNELELIEDFILIKSDGFPTYNFANVIDDHDMNISHVIRGDEFIASTAKHALLYDLLGWQRPKFVHLPVINGTDGKKLSKRHGDTDVLEYRAKGYLPAALLNFLALLGWHPGAGETIEVYSIEELAKAFSLEGLQKSPAIFDPERLEWMNGLYLRSMEPELLLDTIIEFLDGSALASMLCKDRSYALGAVSLIQERLKRLDEATQQLGFFFTDPSPNELDFGKLKPDEVRRTLELSLEQIKSHPELFNDAGELEDFMRSEVAAKLGDKPGPTFMALRIAITGETATPGLFETMVALGPDTVERRLGAAISTL